MNAGEREYPSVDGTIEGIDAQHIQRYEFASTYTHGKRVYDIACGCGYGCLILDAARYSGYDISEDAVEYAVGHFGFTSQRTFHGFDAENLPAKMVSKDVIVSFETIEHLNEPMKFLAWAKTHCETFICSSPIKDSCAQSPFHVREYTIGEFREMLYTQWDNVRLFVQRGLEITTPIRPDDKGVVIAVCWGAKTC